MRKLRRLPWRIPKPHTAQQQHTPAAAPAPEPAQIEAERRAEAQRELLHAQPVAFAGGRYVYGYTPSVPASPTEVRRKTRHRPLRPLPVAG
jgi:hypothetical protein